MFMLLRNNAEATLSAITETQALIEFKPDGTIIRANDIFLSLMGYQLSEIQGRHHRILVDAETAASVDYARFWQDLAAGQISGAHEFKRIKKNGQPVWLEGSYNAVRDRNGRVVKVVKIASDVTEKRLQTSDLLGQLDALNRSQAIIAFDMNGNILEANQNFLDLMGYRLEEIKGRHHRIFMSDADAASEHYKTFWKHLQKGVYESGEYRRRNKKGEEVFVQATYNPIFDLNGKPFKIIKFASDITAQVKARQVNEKTLALIRRHLDDIVKAVEHSNRQAVEISSFTEQTNAGAQGVVQGAGELNGSIRQIADNMQRSREATEAVFKQASAVDGAMINLLEGASSMDGVVKLIQNIAGQINLLALNATIESARAGEAGKGFAVVATEVKNLARQASDATQRIADEIGSLQNVAGDVADQLKGIYKAVSDVRDNIVSAAGAVEQQSMVTQEMASMMRETSTAVAQISSSITHISKSTFQATEQISCVRNELERIA